MPDLPGRQLLRTAAVNEHRSIANMIAVMIRDYCGRVGVEIADGAVQVIYRTSDGDGEAFKLNSVPKPVERQQIKKDV